MKTLIVWFVSVFSLLPAIPLVAEETGDLVPPKIVESVKVKFPVRALHRGTLRGEVWLLVEVDHEGRLADVLPFAHTGRDFANAAVEAIEQWKFAPALYKNEPIGSITRINVRFEVDGVVAYTKLAGEVEERSPTSEPYEYRPYTLDELDRIPRAISRESPIYPRAWIREGRKGSVLIEYFVDEDGYTRFPRVVGEPDELLGAATVQAVKLWRFEPPVRKGQRVLARVRQEFHFYPKESDPSRE